MIKEGGLTGAEDFVGVHNKVKKGGREKSRGRGRSWGKTK